MKETIYLLGLVLILVLVFIFADNSSDIIDENTPIKQESKVYQKYEMSNYR